MPSWWGRAEQHRVGFSFNQFWGNVSIAVDGVAVKRDFRLASMRLGHYRVFVDGELILERAGL
ncbi:hypothetical protein E1292_35505 [Nonomuraea deserti]|uniref:Uncharacterized protein n=1 Tax=Nonomuraea deserti TaxID=1848322 RepID=A0A4R4UZT3_9ACTN|nr:hypothetical protein [Nonomuraea deserti]TDC98308.1 hypothetical protein E1292_35505 [Nonomuraea deserti]